MMIFMCGFAVVFNLAALVSHVNTLVVDGYDPIMVFFGLVSLFFACLAFGMMFKETCLWMEGLRRDLK